MGKQKLTLRTISEYHGQKRDYFSVMKCTARKKFDFIFSFDNDRLKSTRLFIQYMNKLYESVENITHTFDNEEDLTKWLTDNKIYATHPRGAECLSLIIYGRSENPFFIRLSVIRKLENTKKAYESNQL